MKVSRSLITIAVASMIAGGAIAGEGGKDKSGSMGPSFDTLDTNGDGRISQAEAAADASVVFTTADRNGDGYLDRSEWKNRDKGSSQQPRSMPDSATPGYPGDSTAPSDTTPPPAGDPSTAPQPDTETPRQ